MSAAPNRLWVDSGFSGPGLGKAYRNYKERAAKSLVR